MLLLMLACSGKSNGDVKTPAPTPTEVGGPGMSVPAPPPPEAGAEAPGAIVATWLGEPCGERAYPRELTFTPDFRYHGRDLVSPCPEGASCIWSGVVEFSGTWEGNSQFITLSEEKAIDGDKAQPRPTTLRHMHSGHLTSEPKEGVICSFTKQEPPEAPATP